MGEESQGLHAVDQGRHWGVPEVLMLRWFNFWEGNGSSLGSGRDGRHPPGGEGRLLTALDVDCAELLHAAQAGGWQVRVGQVCGLLAPTGAAGGGEARVAGQRRTSGGWVVLH